MSHLAHVLASGCTGLFSHSDQQQAAQTLTCQYSGSAQKGAGGRIAVAWLFVLFFSDFASLVPKNFKFEVGENNAFLAANYMSENCWNN